MPTTLPIRVLHVGKFYSPVEGGIENVVQELVNSFQDDAEVKTSVLVAQRKGPSTIDGVNGTTVRRVASHGTLLGTPLSPGFASEIVRVGRAFDIVHVHVPNPLPFFCNWPRLRRAGTRLIIHHHSDIVRPAQRAFLRCMWKQEDRFYGTAERILVTSQGLLEHSQTLQPYRGSCRVLPLSISLDLCQRTSAERRAAVRAELGFNDEDVVFFFLGRLVYYKGVHDLLRATAKGTCKVLIGGAGPLRAELERLTGELGLQKQVHFLGKIEQNRLPEIFSACDVFVLPSCEASEAFGVVQLEAMAYGLPVINTALRTGVPEVSLHGESGITVPPRDVPALAEAMQILATDPRLRLKYATGALQRVQQFSRANITEKLRSLYREVMSESIKENSVSHARYEHISSGSSLLISGSKGDLRPCSTRSFRIFPQRSSLL